MRDCLGKSQAISAQSSGPVDLWHLPFTAVGVQLGLGALRTRLGKSRRPFVRWTHRALGRDRMHSNGKAWSGHTFEPDGGHHVDLRDPCAAKPAAGGNDGLSPTHVIQWLPSRLPALRTVDDGPASPAAIRRGAPLTSWSAESPEAPGAGACGSAANETRPRTALGKWSPQRMRQDTTHCSFSFARPVMRGLRVAAAVFRRGEPAVESLPLHVMDPAAWGDKQRYWRGSHHFHSDGYLDRASWCWGGLGSEQGERWVEVRLFILMMGVLRQLLWSSVHLIHSANYRDLVAPEEQFATRFPLVVFVSRVT